MDRQRISLCTRRKPRHLWRRMLGLALLLPFLFLAMISQGTMLEAGPAGVRIVLCTDGGMVEAVMAPDGQVHTLDENVPTDHPSGAACEWELHGQPGLADADPPRDLTPSLELNADYSVDIPLHARRVDVLTPAARGPPPSV